MKEDNELDEELKFLMEQIDFADNQKVILSEKIQEIEKQCEELKGESDHLIQSDILTILPIAAKKRDPTIPDFLDTKTKTNYNRQFRLTRHGQGDHPAKRRQRPPKRKSPIEKLDPRHLNKSSCK